MDRHELDELFTNICKLIGTGCFLLCLLVLCEDLFNHLFDYKITKPLLYQFAIIQSIFQLNMIRVFSSWDYDRGSHAVILIYSVVILPIFIYYHM